MSKKQKAFFLGTDVQKGWSKTVSITAQPLYSLTSLSSVLLTFTAFIAKSVLLPRVSSAFVSTHNLFDRHIKQKTRAVVIHSLQLSKKTIHGLGGK